MDLFPTRDQLIEELRAENKRLREDPKVDHHCRICDQSCKRYSRPLYSTPCRLLIALHRLHQQEPETKYFHLRTMFRVAGVITGGGGHELFDKFGLAELGEPGFWRITEIGKDFVKSLRRMPKYVLIYNDIVEGFIIDSTVDITEALGKKFDYRDLMSR